MPTATPIVHLVIAAGGIASVATTVTAVGRRRDHWVVIIGYDLHGQPIFGIAEDSYVVEITLEAPVLDSEDEEVEYFEAA